MSRASTNSGSNNLLSENIGISVFRHSPHIRFLSRTFPFITIMQAYAKSQEKQLLVLVGEGINFAQHLGFVLNPHFDSVWGYILGAEVSRTIFTSHLPFYDALYARGTYVVAAFYGLLVAYFLIVAAIVATHITIGITAARTDRYSAPLVAFNRLALRSLSSWLWIPMLQTLIAPMVCVRSLAGASATTGRPTYYDLQWHFAILPPRTNVDERLLGECGGANHIAYIVLAALIIIVGVPLTFMARWCEYICRSDSAHLKARRHWYADIVDFVHSAVACVLYQVLVGHGYHAAFGITLGITSCVVAGLYVFFLPYYDQRMNYWYVGMHLTTAFASVLAGVAFLNDDWYAMMLSPVLLLGCLPLIGLAAMMLTDWRVNPKFLRALRMCKLDGKLASVRFVSSAEAAAEDELIDTILPLPSPQGHIPTGSILHRLRFPNGLMDETLAVFAPFHDFDARVRDAIIGSQLPSSRGDGGFGDGYGGNGGGGGGGGGKGTDEDEEDNFLSGSYSFGPGGIRDTSIVGGSDRRGASPTRGFGAWGDTSAMSHRKKKKSSRRHFPKKFTRLLIPYITSIFVPTDVELSVSYISQCTRNLHRSPTMSMTLMAMHTFVRGFVKFPHSTFLKLQCGNFIAEHLSPFSYFGIALTNGLQYQENTFSDEFRGIQLKQSLRSALNMRSHSDMIHSKNALAQHREVLQNMQRFWGLLMEPTVNIHLVSAEADLITTNRRIALQHFRRAVQHLSLSNALLIQSTGEFLHDVLLDDEGASECFKEARELYGARQAREMKGPRHLTFVMPDVETLSQRLLTLLNPRREAVHGTSGNYRGVVQHLMAFLVGVFIVLLVVGGVMFYVGIDGKQRQQELMNHLTAVSEARAAAVQFVTVMYGVEMKSAAERRAVLPTLRNYTEKISRAIRTLATNNIFASDKGSSSILDRNAIPWQVPTSTSLHMPFDASGASITTSKGKGGASLRSLIETVQVAMNTVIEYNITAAIGGDSSNTAWSSTADTAVPLSTVVDNDMLLLKESATTLGIALTYQLDVLATVQAAQLRSTLVLLICIFAAGILTLLALRIMVYVSLKRSSLERVFTFQLMTLIPFDALERLATETKERKDSIRRFQGGMERRQSGEGGSGHGNGSNGSGGSPVGGMASITSATSRGGGHSNGSHASLGDAFSGGGGGGGDAFNDHYGGIGSGDDLAAAVNAEKLPMGAANGGGANNKKDPILMSLERSMQSRMQQGGGGGGLGGVGGGVGGANMNTYSVIGGVVVQGGGAGGMMLRNNSVVPGAGGGITVYAGANAVPLKSALKSKPTTGGGANRGGGGGVGIGGANAGGRRAGVGAGGDAIHHASAPTTVKRVTFVVPTKRVITSASDTLYPTIAAKRVVASGMPQGGKGGSGADLNDDMFDEAGYEGISDRTSLLGGRGRNLILNGGVGGGQSGARAKMSVGFASLLRNITLRRIFGQCSRSCLIAAIIFANVLFLTSTLLIGLGVEKVMKIEGVEDIIRQEAELFMATNKSWVNEDTAGAKFIGTGLADELSRFISHSNAVANSIPLYLNLRLGDTDLTDMGTANAMSSAVKSALNSTNGIRVDTYNTFGSLGTGPSSSDAVGLMVKMDRGHSLQLDVKRDALALAAIAHGISIKQFATLETRRADPQLMRRLWTRQEDAYQHCQVLYMASFINSSKGEAPIAANETSSTTLGCRGRRVVSNTTTFAELLAITSPISSPYDMPADFLLLMAGMLYTDMCQYSVDSRKILSTIFDGRMAKTENRVYKSAPRVYIIGAVTCFAAGMFLLLISAVCPVYNWTSYTLRGRDLLVLVVLAAVPMGLAAAYLSEIHLARQFTKDFSHVLNVMSDVQSIFTNTLYQNLYIVSGLARFWTLYDGCRCHIHGTVTQLTLSDDDRRSYISPGSATDLFAATRVVKMLQDVGNALTTRTVVSSLVGVTPTTTTTANNTFPDPYGNFTSNQYYAYAMGAVASEVIQRELNRSVSEVDWDLSSEVGLDAMASYYPDELSPLDRSKYYTNYSYDLYGRTPTEQRQLALKVTYGDRYAKALARITDITEAAKHKAFNDLFTRARIDRTYAYSLLLAALCTCGLPFLGAAYVIFRLAGTASAVLGLNTRNSSNKLDSASSQMFALRAHWGIIVMAVLLSVAFGVTMWSVVRNDAILDEGVKIHSYEYERLRSLLAFREMTAQTGELVASTHAVDLSKVGTKTNYPDISIFPNLIQSSLRDFLFGAVGDTTFYGLGLTDGLDDVLVGSSDVGAATANSRALARDTCDAVLDEDTATRVTTMARLTAAAVESGVSNSTLQALANVYSEYGLVTATTALLPLYRQWTTHLGIAQSTAKAMANFTDAVDVQQTAIADLERIDASIRTSFASANNALLAYFDTIVKEGFTLAMVFTSIFVAVMIVVFLVIVIPLVRNLLEEAENAKLLLRMIPSHVRDKVPAIVQYIDTGKIDNAAELQKKFEASEKLLQNILPTNIATRLKAGEVPIADTHPAITILFTDLVGFTKRSTTMPAAEIVDFLNEVFLQFDTIVELLELEKIKTIGDAYFMAGGLDPRITDHEIRVVEAGLMFFKALDEHNEQHPSRVPLQMRVGVHTGDAVAGVIGTKKVAFDLWGDSVGIANAMESTGVPGFVHISQTTAEKAQHYFILQPRGALPREKESIPDNMPATYLVVGRRAPTPYQHIVRPRLNRTELV